MSMTILLVEDNPDDAKPALRAFEFLEAVWVLGIYWLMKNQSPPERNTA